ncbi:hypothetical protein BU23DRAFT_625297 [Bimuria novae-zelandiae CBS 107.79]|uniref:Uncharacterized protein n=1 Tax=Bimuria novae-zelandiae CBS 107.79 TaxID=1447943 RepID=A0A6A5VSI3_9PLEO|nr:hypothetical protein BU23DRAFT_625297 [Bimuria novae-zelandiae CBS 107.79]
MPLFRRQPQPKEGMITASFPNPKNGHLSPSKVSICSYTPPSTFREVPSFASTPPRPPPHLTHVKAGSASSTNSFAPRNPLESAQSSEYFLEIRKTQAPFAPVSRKSAWGRTIRTERPGEDAFESDAFAIDMPTTREPIFEIPKEASVFRAKIPSPSKAQVDAYQTYKEKAQQVRARNNSEGVRVPSKIVSYDYAYASKNGQPATAPVEVDLAPPPTPPHSSPAGSFPTSPPIAQHAWETSAAAQASRRENFMSSVPTKEPSNISVSRKPIGLNNTASSNLRSRFQPSDSVTGASGSPTGSPPKIKVRLVPRISAPQVQVQAPDPPQKENRWTFYTRTPETSSSERSRSSSPEKHTPRFAYTTSANDQVAATNSAVFTSTSSTPTTAPTPAKRSFADILRDRETRKAEQNRTLASRWARLRPAGPRVAKPTPTPTPTALPTVAKPPPAAPARPTSSYIDPFTLHATPPSTPPPSPRARPRKLSRPIAPPSSSLSAKGKFKFDIGFAQLTSFFSLLLKICVLLYVLVALYYVLDAVREAVHAVGAPFRWVWVVGAWVGGLLARGWDIWGIKIAFQGERLL